MARPGAFTKFLPPPNKGIDLTQPFVSGIPETALDVAGFICRPEGLVIPYGPTTTISSPIIAQTLIPRTLGDFFITNNVGIYTSGGTLQIALTQGRGWYTNFATGAGAFIFFANGVDTVKVYDGTVWANSTFTGPASLANLLQPWVYRHRLYFADCTKLSIWYGGPDSVTGTLTEYNVGSIFQRRGFIAAVYSLTQDGGLGPDDLLAVFSTSGEVALFSGSDPSAPDWQVLGMFYMGSPGCGASISTVNPNFVARLGADLLVLTQQGVQSLAAAIRGQEPGVANTISRPIDPAIRAYYATDGTGASAGCYLTVLRSQSLLLVHISPSYGGINNSIFVRELRSGAWSRFSATSGVGYGYYFGFTEIQYSGSAGGVQVWAIGTNNVRQCFNGTGTAFMADMPWQIRTPYTRLGMADPFRVSMAKPYLWGAAMPSTFNFAQGTAYDLSGQYLNVTGTVYNGAINNFALAEPNLYGEGFSPQIFSTARVNRSWTTMPSHNGTSVSYTIQRSALSYPAELRYYGVDLRVEPVEAIGP